MRLNVRCRVGNSEVQPGSLHLAEKAAGKQTPPSPLLSSKIQPFSALFWFFFSIYPLKLCHHAAKNLPGPLDRDQNPHSSLPGATQSQHVWDWLSLLLLVQLSSYTALAF